MLKPFPSSGAVMMCLALAGCATAPKPAGNFPVNASSTAEIQIANAKARVEPYGLVITGQVFLAPHLPVQTTHSIDIVISGPDGGQIRKFTSQYFPTPKANKRKAQRAHFTMVTYSVPPPGSVINVSLTPEPKPDEPEPPAPENP